MTDPYDEFRADLQAELDEPGAVTRAELAALLRKHPERPEPAPRFYDSAIYDPQHYG